MEYYDDNYNQDNQNENENKQNENNQNKNHYNGSKPPAKQVNNMALASMVCGIFGTLALCACVAFPLSIILGVAAIVLSVASRKGQPFTGYAIAGLVFGILSLVLGVAEGFYMILVNYMLRDPEMAAIFDQIMQQYGTTQGK